MKKSKLDKAVERNERILEYSALKAKIVDRAEHFRVTRGAGREVAIKTACLEAILESNVEKVFAIREELLTRRPSKW